MEGSIRVPIAAGQTEADRGLAAAVLLVLGTAATIAGFLFFQYVLGYQPCPLCLDQRIPYYVALPLALILAIAVRAGAPRALLAVGFILIAAAMLIGGGLGVYHAGVEWKWWAGPTECSGPLTNFGSAGNLLQTIEATRVVRCDEAAWRLFGLSLAGYNVLVSAVLAAVALCGVAASRRG
jgi:disulfide bond formation protein DsbB